MEYHIVPVTPFQQNCTILACPNTKRAAIVDPGGDLDRITAELERRKLMPEKILLTHAHLDHAGGVADLVDLLHLPVEGPHKEDQFWIDLMEKQAAMYGWGPVRRFIPDRWLEQDCEVTVGDETLKVLHCPGHTPGHVVFFHEGSKLAVVGDVLFQGSIGRTDFPRGDYDTLIKSIKENLLPLGDDIDFIPGHGPMSTFGRERVSNPFVSGRHG